MGPQLHGSAEQAADVPADSPRGMIQPVSDRGHAVAGTASTRTTAMITMTAGTSTRMWQYKLTIATAP